jgi:hypothetical protein
MQRIEMKEHLIVLTGKEEWAEKLLDALFLIDHTQISHSFDDTFLWIKRHLAYGTFYESIIGLISVGLFIEPEVKNKIDKDYYEKIFPCKD